RVDTLFVGEYLSAFQGRGVEFAQVRPYIEGDDVRLIDWKVTARMGQPYIKEFEEERELPIFLLCDLSASGNFGTRQKFKRELIAEFAGTISYLAMKHQDKVGLMLFTDHVERRLPARKGRNHFLKIMELLMDYRPEGRGTALIPALMDLGSRHIPKSLIFVVSDYETPEELVKPFKILSNRHDVVIVRVRDRGEDLEAMEGWVTLMDPETGEQFLVNASDPAVRKWMQSSQREGEERVDRLARQLGLDLVDLVTGEDIARAVIRFIKRRKLARRS
ncbi:MAG TPA: DUF58 domain-containing protein, partial [bacterium]|nr:DUF58 domain-containing protein [bacterium]